MSFNREVEAEWIEILTGEALVCALVGRALYAAPDRTWLNGLIAQDVFAELPFSSTQRESEESLALLQIWSSQNCDGLSEAAWSALEADYTRLFVGPLKLLAPPWQSVYADRERLVFQRDTVRVNDFYERFGLELASLHREPADHVGLHFEFLSHVADLSVDALKEGDRARFSELSQAQRDFLRDHMLRWVPRWRHDVDTHARTDFYRGVARLASSVLAELDKLFQVNPTRTGKDNRSKAV